jgi:rhodanese-related sulfurtransferase
MPAERNTAAGRIFIGLMVGWFCASAAAEGPVYITHDLPFLDVKHHGKTVRIERNPDTDNMIDPEYALTSRPCPPFCIQPIVIAPGVETLGEIELLDYLKRMSAGDSAVMLIDSRDGDWPRRSGVIPGAVVIPWQQVFPAQADHDKLVALFEDRFGAMRTGNLWNFAHAKTLIFYCNGPWCGQSPTNIKALLNLGYPAHKIKWYRGGIQDWKMLGLTTVEP